MTSARLNGRKVSFLGRVRVWIWNRGTRAVKVKSRDCSLANDLVKNPIRSLFYNLSLYLRDWNKVSPISIQPTPHSSSRHTKRFKTPLAWTQGYGYIKQNTGSIIVLFHFTQAPIQSQNDVSSEFFRKPLVEPLFEGSCPVADGLAPWDIGSITDQITSTNQWRIKSDVIHDPQMSENHG